VKNIVNTVVLGFRGAKNIGIYGVFFAPRVSKIREITAYLTLFRGPQKCENKLFCKKKKNNNKKNKKNKHKTAKLPAAV
jgi:hypothetical protein